MHACSDNLDSHIRKKPVQKYWSHLVISTKIWKQFRCPSVGEWISKLWYIHTVEYHLAIERNKPLKYITWHMTWSRFSRVCLYGTMDCSLPGSSLHGVLQARTLEWAAMPSSRGSSQPRDRTCVSKVPHIGRQALYHQRCLGSPNKTHDNMDESQGRYAEWRKTVSKGYIPYDSTYVIFSKRQNYSDQWFPGNRVEVTCDSKGAAWGGTEFGGDDGIVLWLVVVVIVTHIYTCAKTQNYMPKMSNWLFFK